MGCPRGIPEDPVSLTAILLLDPLGAQDAEGAARLAVGGQRAAQLHLLVVVAAVQKARLVEGQRVQEAVAGLEEAFHIGQLQAVAVALQLLDADVVAGRGVLGVLQLVAAAGTGHVVGGLVMCLAPLPPVPSRDASPLLHAVGLPALRQQHAADHGFAPQRGVVVRRVAVEVAAEAAHLVLQPLADGDLDDVEAVVADLDVGAGVDDQEAFLAVDLGGKPRDEGDAHVAAIHLGWERIVRLMSLLSCRTGALATHRHLCKCLPNRKKRCLCLSRGRWAFSFTLSFSQQISLNPYYP